MEIGNVKVRGEMSAQVARHGIGPTHFVSLRLEINEDHTKYGPVRKPVETSLRAASRIFSILASLIPLMSSNALVGVDRTLPTV